MSGFKFGLETEFILYSKKEEKFLWGEEINFNFLHDLLMAIPYSDFPSMTGIDQEDAHTKNSPYVIEGYHLKDKAGNITGMIPKGVEIRTPVCLSISECLEVHQKLLNRLLQELSMHDLDLISLSHHPLHDKFWGPQCGRRYDFWQWALEVMTTYGPDINISFPEKVQDNLFNNLQDFEQKINYYAPALVALTLASPFRDQKSQEFQSKTILSNRTFKRSTIAPMIEPHLNENGRMEFKWFEMPLSHKEFEAYFLVCLSLVLDDSLKGRATNQERIYHLGQVSINGLEDEYIQGIAHNVLASVREILPDFNFDINAIEILEERLSSKTLPAHELMSIYSQSNDWRMIASTRSSESFIN